MCPGVCITSKSSPRLHGPLPSSLISTSAVEISTWKHNKINKNQESQHKNNATRAFICVRDLFVFLLLGQIYAVKLWIIFSFSFFFLSHSLYYLHFFFPLIRASSHVCRTQFVELHGICILLFIYKNQGFYKCNKSLQLQKQENGKSLLHQANPTQALTQCCLYPIQHRETHQFLECHHPKHWMESHQSQTYIATECLSSKICLFWSFQMRHNNTAKTAMFQECLKARETQPKPLLS